MVYMPKLPCDIVATQELSQLWALLISLSLSLCL